MKKKNILIIIILLAVILFGIYLYIYNLRDKEILSDDFIYVEFKNKKTDFESNDILDKDIYKDKIINDNLSSIKYNIWDKKENITGDIYIGEDKELYITNENLNKIRKVSSTKFKTLYAKDYEYLKGTYILALSEKNDLYSIELTENDIDKVEIKKIKLPFKVTNFVNIELEKDIHLSGNTVFVLSEDGNIYDISSGIRYREDIKLLYNSMYVYSDNTITDVYGYIFDDKDNKPYKVKYMFLTDESNKFTGKNTVLIITQDNRLLSIEEDPVYGYEYVKKVKDIKFDQYYLYVNGTLEITFEDNQKVELTAECSEFYCINEFIE